MAQYPPTMKFPMKTLVSNGASHPEVIPADVEKEAKSKKRQIFKNLLVVCLGALLIFTSATTMVNLQSSINIEHGLGTTTLSILSATNVFASLVMVLYIIKRFGSKNSIVVGMICHGIYVISNFYPSWYTLVPSSVIMGFGQGLALGAFFTYVNQLALLLSGVTGEQEDNVISRFFGIFFVAFQFSGVVGGVISYSILKAGSAKTHNQTYDDSNIACGADFCDSNVKTNSSNFDVTPQQTFTLVGILSGLALVGVVLVIFLLDDVREKKSEKRLGMCQNVLTIAKRQIKLFHVLLVLLSIYSGIELSYITADFTKAYIACTSGVENVSFVLLTLYATDTVASYAVGSLVKLTGRAPVFIAAAISNVAIIITLLMWTPTHNSTVMLHVIAGIWGIGDGVWQGQVKALYGSLFPDFHEAAFCLHVTWERAGFMISYAYSNPLCSDIKLYILLAVLAVAMTGYLSTEVMVCKKQRGSKDVTTSKPPLKLQSINGEREHI